MADLEGRVALVTGAGRGIGRACALRLAARGAAVAVNDIDSDSARRVAEECAALGVRSIAVTADIGSGDAIERMFAECCERLGSVGILVNNAYRSVRKPFLDLERHDLQATWDVTLMGPFHCSQLAARQMVAAGRGGKIVMISSVLALVPYPTSLPYNTAKAGLEHMAATMAAELAPYRINVNAVAPGYIDTPGERAFASEEDLRSAGAKLPWGRLGTADEVAATVAFLCSSAADYITGSVVRVDGGYWLPRVADPSAKPS